MAILYFDSWCKYEEYKLKEHKEKGMYLCSSGYDLNEYNPFDYATEILFSLLNIGMLAGHGKNMDQQILDFTNRFGLLGFGQAAIEQEYEDCSIKLYNGTHLTKL